MPRRSGLDRGPAGAWRRPLRRDLPGRGLARRLPRGDASLLEADGRAGRGASRRRPSGGSRRWRRAPPSSPRRWRPGRKPELEALAPTGARWPTRWRSGHAPPRTGCPWRDRAGIRPGLRGQPRVGRRAADPARAERRSARAGAARATDPRVVPAALAARSTTSAARRSRPTSPPCATRRNTRGCSGHDARLPLLLLRSSSRIAVLHAYWGLGGVLAGDERGTPRQGGGRHAGHQRGCPAAHGMLRRRGAAGGGCGVAPVRGRLLPEAWPRWLTLLAGAGIAAVFVGRGVAGYTSAWRRRFSEEPFATLDRRALFPAVPSCSAPASSPSSSSEATP